ncbi:MAG: HAD-IC family P-type ATPase [Gemmatimonadaceae bacterium]
MTSPPERAWHTVAVGDVEQALGTAAEGLDGAEAARRLAQYGPNEIEAERQDPWWAILLHQFRDPLIYILIAAGSITLALRDYTDTGVILAVVILNAVIGFVQEYRARKAMQALARLSAPHAVVIRAGTTQDVASRDLVPGDVIVLASGSRVPADVRVTRVNDLEVDESLLTGESRSVRKHAEPLDRPALVAGDQVNMAFAGTTVARGRGRGLVVRTGMATEMGRIAVAMRDVGHTTTPLQAKIDRFGRHVGLVVIALSLLVLVIGVLRNISLGEILLTAVALAVSAIPEGLPVVLTVTLAIGVRRMARRQAIIRSLPAVETLGSTTVIGSDKTGTLTANAMTVVAIWAAGRDYSVSGTGYDRSGQVESDGVVVGAHDDPVLHRVLLSAVLANEAEPDQERQEPRIGDPTELALHVAAAKAGLDPGEARARHREYDILPFESERRYMATLNAGDGAEHTLHLKGAPERILACCDRMLTRDGERPLDRRAVQDAAGALAARGLRVLATAVRPVGRTASIEGETACNGSVFTGLLGMEDPVRPEAVAAVADAHAAGIRVLMLTGDHIDTARTIGGQLGLRGADAISGQEISALSDEELDSRIATVDVYARVAPEHKLRIVQRLKAREEIVAVTGDGVNDAPALRAAHIGVAMGASGTDVAREAADMVLADDNFATITAAIEEGRVVFSNIRKVTFFLLSTAVGEVLAILVALAAGWPLPFIAAQILWINLVTNGLQDVALAFEPGEPGLLRQRPRKADDGVLSRRLLERLGAVGVLLAAGTLGMFLWTLRATGDLDLARTAAMTQMVVFQFFHVFNCRSLDRSIFSIPMFSNKFLFLSIVAAALAHLAVLHLPFLQAVFKTTALPPHLWAVILAVGTVVVLGGELDKWVNRHFRRPIG